MAYEVTATRRRPKTFDELAGQEFVTATLKSSIESGQIAHAFLFSGPRGCGKTSAARILARSLNCERGPTANPCGICASCREISRGASLDIIEIDGASNTSVNDVRQIKDEVLFPPNGGRYKVYIIDEVHMLSNNAFNALLKTIEEPPPYIVFIFATTELHKVPATIKSRCQQFAFRLIPLETITAILKDTCAEMGIAAEDEALFWIAKESTGSLRDAYTLFDQVVSFSAGNIRSALIREKLGLVGLDTLNALADACAANDTAAALGLVDRVIDGGVAIEQFIIDLAGYYRSLLLLKNGVTRESLLGYSPDRFSGKTPESLDSIHLERALDLLLNLYRDIRYSVSPRFELETVVSKLSWLNRWVSPPELRTVIGQARAVLGPGTAAGKPEEGPAADRGVPPGAERGGPGSASPAPEYPPAVPPGTAEPGRAGTAEPPGFGEAEGSEQGIFDSPLQFGKPGTLTEEFRRRMAAREAAPKGSAGPGEEAPDIPPQAEVVRRVFHGTVVKKK
ncbi:MAG: DNA polymerase III subunit gamma/tau [Spirochaetaceae bacterium]|jgi:DNA polymerase-3 subunit gamma/tau|nr:DNA polymerase III subunit gamma/tau [Spirochaetaceae bacterium]